jgi:hypothetical protein
MVAFEALVTAAFAGAASGAASETVAQLVKDQKANFDAWFAKKQGVDKNSSADISNLDSSDNSDESSIEHQTMVNIIQFFAHELETLQHDHAVEIANLNASNDAAIGAKDAQIGTLIAKDAQISTLINSVTNSNAALVSNNAALNAALISNNAALLDIVKNNRTGWFRRVNTGNAS